MPKKSGVSMVFSHLLGTDIPHRRKKKSEKISDTQHPGWLHVCFSPHISLTRCPAAVKGRVTTSAIVYKMLFVKSFVCKDIWRTIDYFLIRKEKRSAIKNRRKLNNQIQWNQTSGVAWDLLRRHFPQPPWYSVLCHSTCILHNLYFTVMLASHIEVISAW